MKYLLAISIGPVQDFIAAARRCRDLWRGSHLLSEMSKGAALALLEHGAILIFPATDGAGKLSHITVANKIVASVESEDIYGLVKTAQAGASTVLQRAADSVASHASQNAIQINGSLFARQLEDFPEFHAAWVPLGNDYPAAREELESLLAARKVLRGFDHYRGQTGLAKSSLDGGRENVIEKRSVAPRRSLKDNEYLDALGVIKRFTGGNPLFDSTTDVAAVPFVRGLKKQRPQVWKQYEEFLTVEELGCRLYSLLYQQESRQLFDIDAVEDREQNNELKRIRELAGTPNPPYYALLHGDGDGMGQAIANLTNLEDHQMFSSRLGDFSNQVKAAVKRREGCAIYCGGDDVLVLLPLDEAFDCASEINQLFRDAMKDYRATFSAGMAVAHALEPLTEVRRWASAAEHEAKSQGKDSLCISVHARSGAPISVCAKWDELTGVLPAAVAHLKNREIPKGLAFDLQSLHARLTQCPELQPVAAAMAQSVIKKKQFEKNAEHVREFASRQASGFANVDRFSRTLLVANWFARAQREAEGKAQ